MLSCASVQLTLTGTFSISSYRKVYTNGYRNVCFHPLLLFYVSERKMKVWCVVVDPSLVCSPAPEFTLQPFRAVCNAALFDQGSGQLHLSPVLGSKSSLFPRLNRFLLHVSVPLHIFERLFFSFCDRVFFPFHN